MEWSNYKNILCVRADNMGDLIMTTPALRALKETFGCSITLLTSMMGSLITPYIPFIDETIAFDLLWVKNDTTSPPAEYFKLIEKLKRYQFDAAIIFTVYSQNPLPTALLLYLAGIPVRLACCRENPYQLLTHWIPDREPYSFIQHQVKRDLALVAATGAKTSNEKLTLSFSQKRFHTAQKKLATCGVDINQGYIVIHPGVSETKREYPRDLWIQTAQLIHQHTKKQILLSGAPNEKELTDYIQARAGKGSFSIAGLLDIEEFIALIARTPLLISVNTSAVHIGAALKTPVIVLYALTNPQHQPWMTRSVVLPFEVPKKLQSRNQVIQYVNETHFNSRITFPTPERVLQNAMMLLGETTRSYATDRREGLKLINE
jgi:ADP-heptose:LPS heptosyltransferase